MIRKGRKIGALAWPECDLAILRKNYPMLGTVGTAPLLPHKSHTAIQSQANRMGLRFTYRKPKVERPLDLDGADTWPLVQVWKSAQSWKAEPVRVPRSVFEVAA